VQRPRVSLLALMSAVAAFAVLFSAARKLDIPSIAKQSFWREEWPSKQACISYGAISQTPEDFPSAYAWKPRLALWVMPAITWLLMWPSAHRRLDWFGIGMIALILLSWVFLRRYICTLAWRITWPDYHIWYCYTKIIYLYPHHPFLWEGALKTFDWYYVFPPVARMTGDQFADLLCLLVLLLIPVARLSHPMPRRLIALVAIPANLYPFLEWVMRMSSARSWLFCGAPLKSSGEVAPHASAMEIVVGISLLSTIAYLVVVTVGVRVPAPCIGVLDRFDGRPMRILNRVIRTICRYRTHDQKGRC
jgi:hypothetical protein